MEENQKVLGSATGIIKEEVDNEGAALTTKYDTIVDRKLAGVNEGQGSIESGLTDWRRNRR